MKFGIEICAMLILQNEKKEKTKRIELTNEDCIRTVVVKENYEYLGAHIWANGDKIKSKMAYQIRKRKLLKTKLGKGNLIKE